MHIHRTVNGFEKVHFKALVLVQLAYLLHRHLTVKYAHATLPSQKNACACISPEPCSVGLQAFFEHAV